MGRVETSAQRKLAEERAELVEIRMLNWCLWKALVPALLIFGLFPLYRYIITLEHPFQRAFAHGELILFGSILLFEIGVDTEGGAHRPWRLILTTSVVRAIAFVLMPVYWLIKHDVIVKEERLAKLSNQTAEYVAIVEKLRNYACMSCTVAVGCLILAGLVALSVLDYHKREELRAFGVPI